VNKRVRANRAKHTSTSAPATPERMSCSTCVYQGHTKNPQRRSGGQTDRLSRLLGRPVLSDFACNAIRLTQSMIINLVFVDPNVPTSFTSAVTSAALMLEKAITDPITVTIQVGYGHFPGDPKTITNGAAEGLPAAGQSFSYSDVVAALSAGKAPSDNNFSGLPSGTSFQAYNDPSIATYSSVLLYPAQEKALGLGGLAATATEIDGFVGFSQIGPFLAAFPSAAWSA
jgi:hypothetical protein